MNKMKIKGCQKMMQDTKDMTTKRIITISLTALTKTMNILVKLFPCNYLQPSIHMLALHKALQHKKNQSANTLVQQVPMKGNVLYFSLN